MGTELRDGAEYLLQQVESQIFSCRHIACHFMAYRSPELEQTVVLGSLEVVAMRGLPYYQYKQLVEIAALAVLFAAAAGQYAGLDYFIRLFTGKCCGRKESVQS